MSTVEDQGVRGAGHPEVGDWFNHQRLLQPIGYIPPDEAEANNYRQLASHAVTMTA